MRAPGSGRKPGSKNHLHRDFIDALAADFAEHGAGVVAIARVEEPIQYLKVIASVIPKELMLRSAIDDMSDDETDALIATIRERLLIQQQQQAPLLIEQHKEPARVEKPSKSRSSRRPHD
jgi:hypothetical protein